MVSVLVPSCLRPPLFFFSPFALPPDGNVNVVVTEEPPVEPAEEEEDGFWPLDGTLGRYSCPEFVADALAADMQSTAAARQTAGIVLRAIIGSVGWRRY